MPKQKKQRRNVQKNSPKNELPKNYNEQIQQLTAMAMSIIHDENNRIEAKQLPDAYQDAQGSVQHQEDAGPKAVAVVSLWVLAQVEKEARRRGKQILPIIVMGVIGEICAQVTEVAIVAGLFEMSEEDMQVGISTAVNKYIIQAKKSGRINDQQLVEVARALQKNFPGEAEKFQKTISARQQRQAQGGGVVGGSANQGPVPAEQQPTPTPQQPMQPGGQNQGQLLRG